MRREAAEPSLEELSSLIEDIHEASLDGTGWLAVLGQMNAVFGSQMATLWMQDREGMFHDVPSVQEDVQTVRDYSERYGSLDALRPAVMRAPAGTIMANWMVVPQPEFVRTEFYNDFASRYDLDDWMMARLLDGPSASGFIALGRSARIGAFEHRDMRLLALLLPHLRRAMRTRMNLAPAGIGSGSALEVLDRLSEGALIVDAEARVVHANRAAEAMLAKRDGLGVQRDAGERRLRATLPEQTRALRRLVVEAADRGLANPPRGGVLRLASDGGACLLASVTPLRAAMAWNTARRPAALSLLSPLGQGTPPDPDHLRALFGLTPAEAAVAGRIVQGDAVEAAAHALRISPATVRTHLSHVFDKTETRRQTELVRLLQQVARLGEP
jgi:DNA-binding CsgD family transcriptional regulator